MMRQSSRLMAVVVCSAAVWACQTSGSAGDGNSNLPGNTGASSGIPGGNNGGGGNNNGGGSQLPPPPTQEHYDPADPTEVNVGLDDGHGTSVLPPAEEVLHVRGRRRMDVDQLNASIRTVTGGIGWTEMRGNNEVDLFVDLSRTLGKPDFVDITAEDLEPSAIFMKFLDDAARSVCGKVITRETAPDAEGNTFFVHASPADTVTRNPDAVNQNLAYLLLRFHGRSVTPDSTQLDNWRWLMRSVQFVNPQQPVEAWRAVCVALITHPDFYSY